MGVDAQFAGITSWVKVGGCWATCSSSLLRVLASIVGAGSICGLGSSAKQLVVAQSKKIPRYSPGGIHRGHTLVQTLLS